MTDEVDSHARETGESDSYVHDPAAFEESGGRPADEGPRESRGAHATDREFGWRGWVLVGFLFVAFVAVPVALYYVPRAQGFVTALGLSLRDAYLVLPLVPALLLGALAVWATTRA